MNHLIHDKYLSTWSQIAAYTRIKPNILKKTHDTILRLPYILVSETKFVVEKIIVDRWLAEVNAILKKREKRNYNLTIEEKILIDINNILDKNKLLIPRNRKKWA